MPSTTTPKQSPAPSNAGALSVEQLFQAAFNRCRDPRSAEYKAGVRAALAFRIEGKRIARLYDPASAADDAYSAGMTEGYALWRAAALKLAESAPVAPADSNAAIKSLCDSVGDDVDALLRATGVMRDLLRLAVREITDVPGSRAGSAIRAAERYIGDVDEIAIHLTALWRSALKGVAA